MEHTTCLKSSKHPELAMPSCSRPMPRSWASFSWIKRLIAWASFCFISTWRQLRFLQTFNHSLRHRKLYAERAEIVPLQKNNHKFWSLFLPWFCKTSFQKDSNWKLPNRFRGPPAVPWCFSWLLRRLCALLRVHVAAF